MVFIYSQAIVYGHFEFIVDFMCINMYTCILTPTLAQEAKIKKVEY